ncbi:MAG: hypothetical protein J6336_03165 [Kiritimatiellae bacterium]|nr:hypothetical protein [Kiritimatiellia bacterium]
MRMGRPIRKTFPVNMMLEGRTVLVVGGGRVGQHKIELLLDSGAGIRLVCPTCVSELTDLAQSGRIEHIAKRFDPADLENATLVFACTDDKHVNRAVLEAARTRQIPCCCADGNWADGDFVTPAIVRSDDILLAVSTNGKSSRRSRLIKDNLKRHLDTINSTDLLVLGTSHFYLPADQRAPYHLPSPLRESVGAMIHLIWGVHEFMILNTCNRIEVVAAVSQETGTCGILRRLLRFDQLPESAYYVKRGIDAFNHLCLVSAGMRSQTPGEFHIVSQLKEALEEANAHGWAGPIINEWASTAMHVSKAIRHTVEPILEVSEIEDVALRYLDGHGIPPGKHALVIGSGMVGRGLTAGLLKRGFTLDWAYHANKPEVPVGAEGRINRIQLADIPSVLPRADLVFSAVTVTEPVLTPAAHAPLLKSGVYLFDLGMPHNIDPALQSDAVGRVGLDELKAWYRTMNGSIEKAETLANSVLDTHSEAYDHLCAWCQHPPVLSSTPKES